MGRSGGISTELDHSYYCGACTPSSITPAPINTEKRREEKVKIKIIKIHYFLNQSTS